MLVLTTEQQDLLESRQVMRRFFIWAETLDDDGDPDPVGFWNDVGTVEYQGRTYHGSGNIIQIASLTAKGDVTIPGLQITFSGIALEAKTMVRGKHIAQRPITVSLGLFDPRSHVIVPPLIPRFIGVIDDCEIETPASGDNGSIVFTCESSSRALTIKRTDTRSDANQVARASGDRFYLYTGAMRDTPIYFGRRG